MNNHIYSKNYDRNFLKTESNSKSSKNKFEWKNSKTFNPAR